MDAAVVCKMLGKAGGTAHTNTADYGSNPTLGVIMGGVDCEATDASLSECAFFYTHDQCDHSWDVGVECEEPGAMLFRGCICG